MNWSKSQITLANDIYLCGFILQYCDVHWYALSICYGLHVSNCGCTIQLFRGTHGMFQIVISIFCSVIAANPLTLSPQSWEIHSNKTRDRYKVHFWSGKKRAGWYTRRKKIQPSNRLTHGAHFDFTAWHISRRKLFCSFGWLAHWGSFWDGLSNATFVLHIFDFEASLLGSTMYHVSNVCSHTLNVEHASISTSMCLRASTWISSSFRLLWNFSLSLSLSRQSFRFQTMPTLSVQAHEINVKI